MTKAVHRPESPIGGLLTVAAAGAVIFGGLVTWTAQSASGVYEYTPPHRETLFICGVVLAVVGILRLGGGRRALRGLGTAVAAVAAVGALATMYLQVEPVWSESIAFSVQVGYQPWIVIGGAMAALAALFIE